MAGTRRGVADIRRAAANDGKHGGDAVSVDLGSRPRRVLNEGTAAAV